MLGSTLFWTIEMPVTCCSDSTTLLSGSLPMSSETMESSIWLAFCLICSAPLTEATTPVTVTDSIAGAAAFCAWAAVVPAAMASARAEMLHCNKYCFLYFIMMPFPSYLYILRNSQILI